MIILHDNENLSHIGDLQMPNISSFSGRPDDSLPTTTPIPTQVIETIFLSSQWSWIWFLILRAPEKCRIETFGHDLIFSNSIFIQVGIVLKNLDLMIFAILVEYTIFETWASEYSCRYKSIEHKLLNKLKLRFDALDDDAFSRFSSVSFWTQINTSGYSSNECFLQRKIP